MVSPVLVCKKGGRYEPAVNDEIPFSFHLLSVLRRTGGVAGRRGGDKVRGKRSYNLESLCRALLSTTRLPGRERGGKNRGEGGGGKFYGGTMALPYLIAENRAYGKKREKLGGGKKGGEVSLKRGVSLSNCSNLSCHRHSKEEGNHEKKGKEAATVGHHLFSGVLPASL